ncbi:MAG: hypothetical protein E7429_01270 [Ruminococcaceae bacterium]|nr:hypothetical protein [Oscillospiraceae bacterium]
MRNANTMSRTEYVWKNLYWVTLVFLLYRNTLFRPLFTFDRRQSLLLLAGSVILGASIGILLTYKRRRNYVNLLCNILLSYGIYYTASLWFVDHTRLPKFALAAGILAAGYALLVFTTYAIERARSNLDVSVWKCLSSCLLNCRTLIACVLAASVIFTVANPLLGIHAEEPQEDPVVLDTTDISGEDETIAKNIDVVLLLQEEEWAHLDAAKRLDVMKTIADIEANYLGIPEVTVCTGELEEFILGHYTDGTRTITLNSDALASADAHTMLTTICHECYHAYQHRLVDLYNELDPENKDLLLFYEAAQYRNEFANYIDGFDDYYAYRSQWCEADSTEYAEDSVIDYYRRIDQYKKEQETGEEE